jgi:hypothetical protein
VLLFRFQHKVNPCRLASLLKWSDGRDSHFTGVKPPKPFSFVSRISPRGFA